MVPVTLIVPVLKPLIADRFGASTFATHSFMWVNTLGAMAAAPLLALLSDRGKGRGRIVMVALLLDGALLFGMALVPSLGLLLFLRAVEGACHLLALSAMMAAAADSAAATQRGRMMGVVGSCMMLGTAAGTRLGGVVWQVWPGRSFEVAALVAVAAAFFAWGVVPEGAARRGGRRLRDALTLLGERRGLLIAYSYTFIDRFCVGVIISSLVLFLGSIHELQPEAISKLLVLFLGPFALLIYPAGRLVDRIGFTLPLVVGSAAFGVLFASYGFAPVGWLPAVMVVSGVVSSIMFAPTLSLCAALTPTGGRGSAYAGFNLAGSLGFVCGPLVAGAVCGGLQATIGPAAAFRVAFVVAGASQLVCAAVTLPRLVRVQRELRVGKPSGQAEAARV